MVKIKRVEGQRLFPGYNFEYFRNNPELWYKLKAGEVIEVPKSLVELMTGVKIVKERKKREEKIEEFTSLEE